MRFSAAFIPTLRQTPADAELISHKLLLRGGFIRKLSSGIYSWLPLGYRVVQRIADIVRQENDSAGGQELLLPALQPAELWDETGRSGVDVLFRLKDRYDRELVLGMTHEEVITDILRGAVRSYRQLPLMLYQIQTKFRDEPRPRGGVIRGREFMMHDCYSFHSSPESLDETYARMQLCYERMLRRMGLDCLTVEAEPGVAGGSMNHEFMIPVDSGEDTILICDSCGYAANAQRCGIGDAPMQEPPEPDMLRVVDTPGRRTVEDVSDFLEVAPQKLIKTLLFAANDGVVVALVRGDRELNEAKLSRALGGGPAVLAEAEVIQAVTGAPVGYAGPHGLQGVTILADKELQTGGNWISGANLPDAHAVNLNPGRDFDVSTWADLRVAMGGDPCPRCAGTLVSKQGIEAAHIFKLGTTYSEAMGAQYQDQQGHSQPIFMGTYGLGITRVVAAIAEQLADADGLIWPASVAPCDVALLCLNMEEDGSVADKMCQDLERHGLSVLYDDRKERAGVKFKDADLIGIPVQLVLGRGVREGKVEVRVRGRADKRELSLSHAVTGVCDLHKSLLAELEHGAPASSAVRP